MLSRLFIQGQVCAGVVADGWHYLREQGRVVAVSLQFEPIPVGRPLPCGVFCQPPGQQLQTLSAGLRTWDFRRPAPLL